MVGTWIDGKPIYQRTFTGLTTPPDAYPQTNNVIDMTTFNVKEVICIDGFMGGGETNYNVPINTFADESFYLSTRREGNYIIQVCNGWTNRPEVITIKYTKTTD